MNCSGGQGYGWTALTLTKGEHELRIRVRAQGQAQVHACNDCPLTSDFGTYKSPLTSDFGTYTTVQAKGQAQVLANTDCIIVMIRWTGLAPREFEFPYLGRLTSTFLVRPHLWGG